MSNILVRNIKPIKALRRQLNLLFLLHLNIRVVDKNASLVKQVNGFEG